MHVSQMPAMQRMVRARSQLITSAPFYGALALQHATLVERADVGTAGVDGRNLYFAPDFVTSLTEPELIGLYVHEILHLALCHHARRGNREPDLWNDACDYAVNPMVIAAGYTLPAGALISAEFTGQPAERIYAELFRRRQQGRDAQQPGQGQGAGQGQPGQGQPQPGQGQPGQGAPGAGQPGQPGQPGQGQGQPGAGGGFGKVLDAAPDAAGNDAAAAEMESSVRQAVAIATSAAGGKMPGDGKRILEDLNRSRINWRETLARFIDDAAERVTDWNRPSKRFLDADFFMPSTAPDSIGCIGVAVDVSGSIDAAALRALGSELQGILDGGRVERIRVVTVSTHVTGFRDYVPGDAMDMRFRGSGGTAFAPAWAHFEAHGIDPAAVVYLTDLDPAAGTWGAAPAYPVLWAVYGRKREAPFGEVMPLDPHS